MADDLFNSLYSSPYSTALNAAPDLYNTPSLAISAGRSDDPASIAQALAHVNKTLAASDAAQEHQAEADQSAKGRAFYQSVLSKVGGGPLDVLSQPLHYVQHEYRYLHDVYVHHGIFAGISQTLLAAAGATVAQLAVPIPGIGAALGAEATVGLQDATGTLYRDSWNRSDTEKVSPGRDLANLFGLHNTDSGWGQVVSGVADAGFDFTADPLVIAGKFNAVRKSAEGLTTASRSGAVNRFASRVLSAPGLAMDSPERIDAARASYKTYNNALKHIAKLNAGDIVTHYPELQPLAADLAAAKTADAVHNVFKDQVFLSRLDQQARTNLLPTRTVMRVRAHNLTDRLAGDTARTEQRPLLLPGRQRLVGPDGENTQRWQLGAAFHPLNSDAWRGAMARKVRTFSGYMPYAIDDATGDISMTKLDIADDTNLQGLLRAARFAMGERTARKWIDGFVKLRDANGAPMIDARLLAYKELLPEILKSAGMVDDPNAVAYLTNWSRHVALPSLHTVTYGHGVKLGDDVNVVEATSANPFAQRLGLHSHQENTTVTLPNFRALKTAMRDSSHYTKWYGKLDDFANHYYTNGFFKPLALLTMGFGIRVAAAEAIPASFRYGGYNMLKGRVAATAAKMNYKLLDGEDHHVIAAASKLAGGVDKLLNSPETRDLAFRLTLANEGHIARGVASAGHNSYILPDDPRQAAHHQIDQAIKRKVRTGNWRTYTQVDPEYVDMWHYGFVRRAKEYNVQHTAADFRDGLSRGMTEDDAAQHAVRREAQRIQGVDPNTGLAYAPGEDPYVIERQKLARYTAQDPEQFAAHRVDDMRNYVTGADGTLHDDLLQKFIDGDASDLTVHHLRNIDPASRPDGVAGEVLEPPVDNIMQRVISSGFKRIIDPVINYLSREPIYFNEMAVQWKGVQPLIEKGILTEDSAFTLAQIRSVRGMLPQIHNTALRSQFAVMMSNLLPFYFAQEQALKRAGHLIRRNPAAFRKYQMTVHALHDPAFIQTDQFGQRHLVFPVIGEMGSLSIGALSALGMNVQTGLPMTVSGDIQSLKTVLPETALPSASPFAAIAISELAKIDPSLEELASKGLGERGFNEPLINAILPNTSARTAYHAWRADVNDRTYANALLSALQSAYFHGQMPGPNASDLEKHKFLQTLRNNARVVLGFKAVLAEVSPLSPSVSQEDAGFRDEWSKLLGQVGDKKMTYEQALNQFLKEHGHGGRAIAYTVARTESTTGASMSYTTKTFNYLTAHEGLIKKHPWGAAFSGPGPAAPDDNSLAAYDEVLRTGLGVRRDPESFQKAVYTAQGMNVYFRARHEADAAIKQAGGAETPQGKQVESMFSNWKSDFFRTSQPVAYDYLTGPEASTNAKSALDDIISMFRQGEAPHTVQASKLAGLLGDYAAYRVRLAQLGAGTTDRTFSSQRQQVRDMWSTYLDDKAKDPDLINVVRTVFSRLPEV